MKIKKFKRGVWMVLERGMDRMWFDTEQEADDYINPPKVAPIYEPEPELEENDPRFGEPFEDG